MGLREAPIKMPGSEIKFFLEAVLDFNRVSEPANFLNSGFQAKFRFKPLLKPVKAPRYVSH